MIRVNRETRRREAALARKETKANPKGEVLLDLGFRKLRLKASLGAIAQAEDHFGCDFADLEDHFTSTKALANFIAILARAAGEDVSEEDVQAIRYADIELSELMAPIQAAMGKTDTPGPQAQTPVQ